MVTPAWRKTRSWCTERADFPSTLRSKHASTIRKSSAWAALALSGLLQACAAHSPNISDRVGSWLPADAILLGEQHDAAEHQRLQRGVVLELARRGQLAALVIEMAEQTRSTAGLARDAGEAEVRLMLRWDEAGWPWQAYGPVVMAAVQAGVPVLGANLERSAMRQAMSNELLDSHLPAEQLARQRENIRAGHCQLLPESQIAPMTRIQLARDAAMASTVAGAAQTGKTVLLVAGGGHVTRTLGVPTHLPATLGSVVVLAAAGPANAAARSEVDAVWETPSVPSKDHCAALQQKLRR